MASGIYNRAKYNLMTKQMDMDTGGDTFKVILLDNSHTFDADNNQLTDINANEISGTGYSAGGKTLTGQVVTQDDANDKAVFDGNDIQWTSATFSAYHAGMYDDTISYSGGADDLVLSIDFGGAKSVISGTFTIQWNSSGISTIS